MGTIQSEYQSRVDAGVLHDDPVQRAALAALERVRTDVLAVPAAPKKSLFRKAAPVQGPKGLYLWGGVGRGKSMLMDLLYEMVEVPKQRSHFHAFMQWVHEAIANARKDGVDDAIAPVAADLAARVRFLAFDEMQISDITDAMIVGRLFEALFDAGVVVVTTSNRVPDDLYKDGLNRQLFLPFIDLLREKMVVHELASDMDYRQTVLEGAAVYFSPANGEARQKVDALFVGLTQGEVAPLTLRVKGRDVVVPAFANGVARASFRDLCGVPLGAADYLALADAARVLILEDIPRLSRSNFNEAKRFVTLIDTLYEAKVRLIASAAAVPEMLYVEGTGVFEFERTASRLREMQGEDWGRDAEL
ncbi:cell division protein ZapE [Octadecabacter sp. 1_MG-2023]|uniref:cell division protein ZapE n=1 Tax=unclassified Octadecabacter TaxID=196158 RepID=UPI001C0942B8|nr:MULTISPECIES: cell division protein ZapE [unclassified Octadecabacter]MBU2992514.1 AFG1 family ATPase [Octadecabacter sp. B2R22]MDO6734729.1 cell division protein ZapE [Octadecabacter sp. 1_MG-2023]